MPTHEILQYVRMLLEIKVKAHRGMPWTTPERAAVELCMEENGILRVLAACCVLASTHRKPDHRALGIIREAIERKHMPAYLESSVYEALTFVRPHQLAPLCDALLLFIEHSLIKRIVNLNNTIVVLGKLARGGETRALALLRSLANDSDSEVRDNASLVLRGIGSR